MTKTISDLICLAKGEVGYLEKKTNSCLDDKTKNAGYNNWTKYARDLDCIQGFYNGKKNGYAWCSVFVAWCFVRTFGLDRGRELLNYPEKSLGAGVYYAKQYFTKIKRYYTSPQVGDCIFFKNASGGMQHIGIVYNYDKTYVYTVEGNTSSGSEVVSNGGAVCLKKYKLSNCYIDGYGRPNWSDAEKGGCPEPSYTTMYVSGVDYEGLNVRETPNGKVLRLIPVGTELKVYSIANNWACTDMGYVYATYINKKKPAIKYTTSSLNVRKNYTISSALITTLAKGVPVQVFATKKGWCKISPTANAWVAGNYLK